METIEPQLSLKEKYELISTLEQAEKDGLVLYNSEATEKDFIAIFYAERKKRAA